MGSSDALIPQVMDRIFRIRFRSLLDCACGLGKWGYLTKIRLGMVGEEAYLIGCDLWLPNLKLCKQHEIYDDHVRCDIRAIPFRQGSFDIVVACEVLEHLIKTQGLVFISQAERVASNGLVISTPNGEWPQETVDGNEYQKHRSAWSSSELQKLGFEVTGVGGPADNTKHKLLRFLGRGRGLPALGTIIFTLAEILSPRIPRLGAMLVASKTALSVKSAVYGTGKITLSKTRGT